MSIWKWARLLTKNTKKLVRMSKIFAANTKWHNIKYKYGVKVLRNVNKVISFYCYNGNTLYQDAIGK